MNTLKKISAAAATATMVASMLVTPAFAVDNITPGDTGLKTIQKTAGFGDKNIYETIGYLIQVALTILGIIAILLVIYGGFRWMTSGGEEKGVEQAKKILMAGVIGLLIILSAYAITSFVLGSLITATGNTGLSGV